MTSIFSTGNNAVITGGANGIGFAAAKKFSALGMNVVIADVNENALLTASEELSNVKTFVCDISKLEDVQSLFDFASSELGSVDCLMNNAGAAVTRAKPWEDTAGWRKQLDINLWGIIYGCQTFIPSMLEANKPAVVINTGSKQGITNPPGGYAYNLSKAGVLAYTQSVAHELRQIENCPLSAHLLVPGFTYSAMISAFVKEKPPSAWSTDEVVDFMIPAINNGDFYVICPDHDTPRQLDEKRIQWNTDDLIKNRPALSRWHPDFADEFESFMKS
jgi:NAD(P)-dependent dehydrogenase (short-subunit alcohol dehydrogenase family)